MRISGMCLMTGLRRRICATASTNRLSGSYPTLDARSFSLLSLEFHRLVVIGAGPGGLVLARVLQKAGLDVVVFEREASRDGRTQGGTLDLHIESGQWALEQAGLLNEFRAIARPEGQYLRIANKHGQLLCDEISERD